MLDAVGALKLPWVCSGQIYSSTVSPGAERKAKGRAESHAARAPGPKDERKGGKELDKEMAYMTTVLLGGSFWSMNCKGRLRLK